MDSRKGQTGKKAGGREEGIRRGSVVIWRGLSNKVYGDSLSQGWGWCRDTSQIQEFKRSSGRGNQERERALLEGGG